jgi:hypothetical protein
VQELLIEASSSFLVSKSVKDQSESPLFVAMVRFQNLNKEAIPQGNTFSQFAAVSMA